jgi:acetyltransferase-like isoleucine patch superfamily enzyme
VIHPTAEVSPEAQIGEGTRIWRHVQVREGAVIGRNCILGKGVYVDTEVHIGDNCKLENSVYVYRGVTVEDGVFLGPAVICLNDKHPRAVNPDGSLKTEANWQVSPSHIGMGAAIGGGSVILPGVNIGRWALVGAGSVVTSDVPDHGLAYGNPARLRGFVCMCGQRLQRSGERGDTTEMHCNTCGAEVLIPTHVYVRAEQ